MVAKADQRKQSLSTGQLKQLASIALIVQRLKNKHPQDIEWAFTGEKLWLLQSRSITNLPPPPLKNVNWTIPGASETMSYARRKLSELAPGPVSELFVSLHVLTAFQQAQQITIIKGGYNPANFARHFASWF